MTPCDINSKIDHFTDTKILTCNGIETLTGRFSFKYSVTFPSESYKLMETILVAIPFISGVVLQRRSTSALSLKDVKTAMAIYSVKM